MKLIVLGAGLVGGTIAADLAQKEDLQVYAADTDSKRLDFLGDKYPLTPLVEDLADPRRVTELVSGYDLAVNALPGWLGYQTLAAIIDAGTACVDLAFFPEDPFRLEARAREKGVVAIVDCGIAPGMSNLLAASEARKLDSVETLKIYVGGLPEQREWPYEYKAVFSPRDVIEEYIRPARYVEHGRRLVKPALLDRELVDFDGIGTLEAFISDGLRTLLDTLDIPNMEEKTLRYPGHAEKMLMLRESGFFSGDPLAVNGHHIRPLDLTTQLLFPKWQLEPGERDFTVLRLLMEGRKNDQEVRLTVDMLDRYDEITGFHSMARTTGFTAATAARMILKGYYTEPGISPLEFIGRQPRCVDFMLQGMAEHGIHFQPQLERLPAQPQAARRI